MDRQTLETLRNLGLLTDEQVAQLSAIGTTEEGHLQSVRASLVAAAQNFTDASDQTLTALAAIADTVDAIKAEEASRVAAADERARRREELLAGLTGMPSPGAIGRRSGSNGVPQNSDRGRSRASLVAAGGHELNDAHELAERLIETYQASRHDVVGDEARHYRVASLISEYPEERTLTLDPRLSLARIRAATDPTSLVASGGLCAPVGARYELENTSTPERPIRDALPDFGADRGGIRYTTPPSMADVAGAITVWTHENDVTPGSDGPETKNVLRVPCGDEEEVLLYAVAQALRFGNFSARAFPEQVETFSEKTIAAHARVAENRLLELFGVGSIAVSTDQELSATRDLLAAIDVAAAGYRWRNRMADTAVLRAILPAWVRNLIRTDLARQIPGDNALAVADQEIDRFFSTRNIAPVFHLDGDGFAAQTPGMLLPYPTEVTWYLFAEGSWLFLDGGRLDLGIVRDTTLIAQNDFEMFAETFESVAFVGDAQSLEVTSTVCPSGATSASEIAPGCVVGS